MPPEIGSAFDAAPFARALPDGCGLIWEDPREVHRVIVRFAGPPPGDLTLGYWRTRWPQQRLPKDAIPGGGNVGWWELGNWFTGQWQAADAECAVEGNTARFTFRPLNATEFPDLADFPATYRTTLKLRLVSGGELPEIEEMSVLTDSSWDSLVVTTCFETPPTEPPSFEVFNGHLESVIASGPDRVVLEIMRTRNADPNSFDKTYLTVKAGDATTVAVGDLDCEPVCVPERGLCLLAGRACGDYASVWSEALAGGQPHIRDLVAEVPEQTWTRAWANMVPKRQRIYLALAADGARHKFRLNPDGSVQFRTNNSLLTACRGKDTDRLTADADLLSLSFGLPAEPVGRMIQDDALPIGITTWETGGLRIQQVAFATPLEGTDPGGPPPPADSCGVLMLGFEFRNDSAAPLAARLEFHAANREGAEAAQLSADGLLWAGDKLRALVDTRGCGACDTEGESPAFRLDLPPASAHTIIVKVPYLALEGDEVRQLRELDFEAQRAAVAAYWTRRLSPGMKLTTPEPLLNHFHQAHVPHLFINCEREPGSDLRFARVGSFGYAAFGNESCMMIVDLDRRGYHREARECLEAFVRYQGTVPLPGDFSSHDGVLYGAHGYEHGGYNQHHGWILWNLVEHFKFTRDADWLQRVSPSILAAADWIVRERSRTASGPELSAGLLPFGSLEDIGDWWPWMSTNAYTWRGLDAAAWGLEQLGHPEAGRVRREADDYREAILRCFREAAQRSPVVRLRDGSWVPHFPSHPYRRGRAFGWICETLEGAIHLLITGLISPSSPEARWILDDYEDNLHLSPLYGYQVADFAQHWFDWGGFSMQACLLFDVEPYLYRDDMKHALRATFNAIAANFYDDVLMICEHALPELGDLRGDHYKTSDEANAAGWLRYLFAREDGDELLLGQGVPRFWLAPGNRAGLEGAATHFGPMSLIYEAAADRITAHLSAPRRNPPTRIRLRFRAPESHPLAGVLVNGVQWTDCQEDWVILPGDIGDAVVVATLA